MDTGRPLSNSRRNRVERLRGNRPKPNPDEWANTDKSFKWSQKTASSTTCLGLCRNG